MTPPKDRRTGALSQHTTHVLWQNIVFAITVKAVFFVLTFAGVASLWLAVLADMGASLIVIANGLRPLRHPSHLHPPTPGATPSSEQHLRRPLPVG